MAFRLRVVTGTYAGHGIHLQSHQCVSLGRTVRADITFDDDPLISSQHCEIEYCGGSAEVRDLGSTNGTYLNEQAIREAQLRHGDRLRIGSTELTVELEPSSGSRGSGYPAEPGASAANGQSPPVAVPLDAHAQQHRGDDPTSPNRGIEPGTPQSSAASGANQAHESDLNYPESGRHASPGSYPAGSGGAYPPPPAKHPSRGPIVSIEDSDSSSGNWVNAPPPSRGREPIGHSPAASPPSPSINPILGSIEDSGSVDLDSGDSSLPAGGDSHRIARPAAPPPEHGAQRGASPIVDSSVSIDGDKGDKIAPSESEAAEGLQPRPGAIGPHRPAASPETESTGGRHEDGELGRDRRIVPAGRMVRALPREMKSFQHHSCMSGIASFRTPDAEIDRQAYSPTSLVDTVAQRYATALVLHFQRIQIPTPEELAGAIPLFDWLPTESARPYGPVLVTYEELVRAGVQESIDQLWGQDGCLIFCGANQETLQKHLAGLIHRGVPGLSEEGGIFHYCWPSVLSQLLENQPESTVQVVLGDAVRSVFMELPQQRLGWRAYAAPSFRAELQAMGFREAGRQEPAGSSPGG